MHNECKVRTKGTVTQLKCAHGKHKSRCTQCKR